MYRNQRVLHAKRDRSRTAFEHTTNQTTSAKSSDTSPHLSDWPTAQLYSASDPSLIGLLNARTKPSELIAKLDLAQRSTPFEQRQL